MQLYIQKLYVQKNLYDLQKTTCIQYHTRNLQCNPWLHWWGGGRWVITCILKSESWGKRKIPGTDSIKRQKTSREDIQLRLQDVWFICDWLKWWPDHTHKLPYLNSVVKWAILHESQSNRGTKEGNYSCIDLPPFSVWSHWKSPTLLAVSFPVFLSGFIHLAWSSFHSPGQWGTGSQAKELFLVSSFKHTRDESIWILK